MRRGWRADVLGGLVLSLAARIALSSGCAQPDAGPVVCEDCTPWAIEAPGDSSSTASSSQLACALAYSERNIGPDEAESLGFAVTQDAARIEAPFDVPMQWVAMNTDGGGPASGYEHDTRVRGAFTVESYDHWWLDPARCDGTTCTLDERGQVTEQPGCPRSMLLTRVSGHLETLDGAIVADFPNQAVSLRRIGEDYGLGVAAAVDLGEVRGSLVLAPSLPSPRVGRLDLSWQLGDSIRPAYGVIHISVTPDWTGSNAGLLSSGTYYAPLEGRWGDPPTGAASVSPAP